MNIKPLSGCCKALSKISQNFLDRRYVKISHEFSTISPEVLMYLKEIKSDIVTFAKSNKVKVKIAPRENYLETLDKYNMEFLSTNIKFKNRVKQKPFTLSSMMDTNSKGSVFGLFKQFGEIVPFKSKPTPFKEELLSHLSLLLDSLKHMNSV